MAKKQTKTKSVIFIDWIVILLFPVVAALITIFFQTSFLLSIIMFFILPSIYISFRDPRFTKKLLICTVISIPFTIIIDYFATRDGAWMDSTIFPFRVLNGFALEDFLWVAGWFYYLLAFYEYFIDQGRNVKDAPINKKWYTFLMIWFAATGVFAFLYVFFEKYLHIPYFYFVFTLVLGVVPTWIAIVKRPRFIHKFFILASYFFFVSMLHEYSAFVAKQWVFPGENFLGWVSFKGGFGFPIEELVFWMMFGAIFVITYYEYLVDDKK